MTKKAFYPQMNTDDGFAVAQINFLLSVLICVHLWKR